MCSGDSSDVEPYRKRLRPRPDCGEVSGSNPTHPCVFTEEPGTPEGNKKFINFHCRNYVYTVSVSCIFGKKLFAVNEVSFTQKFSCIFTMMPNFLANTRFFNGCISFKTTEGVIIFFGQGVGRGQIYGGDHEFLTH